MITALHAPLVHCKLQLGLDLSVCPWSPSTCFCSNTVHLRSMCFPMPPCLSSTMCPVSLVIYNGVLSVAVIATFSCSCVTSLGNLFIWYFGISVKTVKSVAVYVRGVVYHWQLSLLAQHHETEMYATHIGCTADWWLAITCITILQLILSTLSSNYKACNCQLSAFSVFFVRKDCVFVCHGKLRLATTHVLKEL